MPIGKNSLKRVANNGYSNVKTEAPDMENSVNISNVEVKAEKKKAPAKTATKKSEVKKTGTIGKAKSADVKKASVGKAETKEVKAEADSPKEEAIVSYVNVGRDMPSYLL